MAFDAPGATLGTDLRALDELRRRAKDAPGKTLGEVARQFEALYINLVMKSMREATAQEDPLASSATRSYTAMLDQSLAQRLSGKGLGLAEVLTRQMSQQISRQTSHAPHPSAPAAAAPARPEDFVRGMLPHARAAEREFGIPAQFSVGQAALESGWGRRELRAADGSPSYNVFGVKAGGNWSGRTVEARTIEYVDGRPRSMVQKFRAYSSYGEAFRDHARLLAGSSRYAGAVQAGGDAAAFAAGVQAGGYATDPRYAQKLTQVINRTLSLQAVA
ncbi:MAG: flagellar assembly peptidoglycan hydrolase FlgJ [Betaproteobacteria bacterium]|nr:flagellar assembly peptidoglycan hydrolase FlgJ [Betaproteobacteria bacterium]